MTVVFALLVLAVVVAGVVLVVKSPAITEPTAGPGDSGPTETVAAMLPEPISAADLRQVRFPVAFRGYRMDEVDALLNKLAAQLEPPAPTGPPVISGTEQPR